MQQNRHTGMMLLPSTLAGTGNACAMVSLGTRFPSTNSRSGRRNGLPPAYNLLYGNGLMKRLPPTGLFLVIILFITFGSVAVNGQARKRPRGKATRRTAAATESAANLTDRLIRLTDIIYPEIRLSLRLRTEEALQNT